MMPSTQPNSYDAIPYASFPITETHPDRLSAIGHLFGLSTAAPASARILELGCAEGGNLLPIAWFLPQTQCLGLELSATQVRTGQQHIQALGLQNIEIRQHDLLEFPAAGEPFDYIIAHGVYSWVPAPVRQHLLAICRGRLAPGGIAYISYNTLPGGHARALLRDILLYHVRHLAAPSARLQAARECLNFLSTPLTQTPPGHAVLQEQVQQALKARDSYFYHEYLSEYNQPILFQDFMAAAHDHGLQFLAESQLHTLFTDPLGQAASAALSQWDDLLQEEQYADFLRLRAFRQTLLCRSEEPLTREIDLEHLLQNPFYADLTPVSGKYAHNASGQGFAIPSAALRRQVETLSQSFPQAVHLTSPLPFALQEELFNLYISGGIQPSHLPPQPATWGRDLESTPFPRASALARHLAHAGQRMIPTPRHQALHLDTAALQLLIQLDGLHDPGQFDQDSSPAPDSTRKSRGKSARTTPPPTRLQTLISQLQRHGLWV